MSRQFHLLALYLLLASVHAVPLEPRTSPDTCQFTSPVNSDCSFDWNLDVTIGSVDISDPSHRNRIYASTYHAVQADEPSRGGRGGKSRRDLDDKTVIYTDIISRFKKAYATITTMASKAYKNVSDLTNGYSDSGPEPPTGMKWCDPTSDPWTWCDAVTNEAHLDTTPYGSQQTDDTSNSDGGSDFKCGLAGSIGPCPGTNVTTIRAVNGSAVLHHAPNGNIYSFDTTRFSADARNVTMSQRFSAAGSYIMGDSRGRLFHGYADTLATYNVSRLRLSDSGMMPNNSLPVAIVPARNPSGGSAILIAADTSSYVYYLITCDYESSYAKIFLAKTYASGMNTLMDPTLQGSVTGGSVTACQLVPYASVSVPI